MQISIPLHNILTKEAVDLNVAASLLNCFESGENAYHSYRQEVFIERKKKLTTAIAKRKLPCFSDQPHKLQPTTKKVVVEKTDLSAKDIAMAYRNINIARE